MTWHPIETAPKDGTWILVSHPKWDICERVRVANWSYYANTWQTVDEGVRPTHWVPLPDPPQPETP